MSSTLDRFVIVFPEWYDARAEWEHSCKGFLPSVMVQLKDGRRFQLYFMDPVRLQQDAEAEFQLGEVCFTEPGLIVIPEVTRECVQAAVAHLYEAGFFEYLKPVPFAESP